MNKLLLALPSGALLHERAGCHPVLCHAVLCRLQISRPAYGKLARLYRQHWLTTTAAAAGGGPGTAGGAADLVCTVGLPPSEALAQLQLLQAASRTAAAATAADPPVKRHKATHETAAEDESDSGSGSDSEGGSDSGNLGPEGAAAAGLQSVQGISSKSGCSPSQRQYLDAEAQLAEVEQQQPDADDDGGGGGSSTNSSSSAREQFHARLFALLLRYKSIQGHGFQVSGVFEAFQGATAPEGIRAGATAHVSRQLPVLGISAGSTGMERLFVTLPSRSWLAGPWLIAWCWQAVSFHA